MHEIALKNEDEKQKLELNFLNYMYTIHFSFHGNKESLLSFSCLYTSLIHLSTTDTTLFTSICIHVRTLYTLYYGRVAMFFSNLKDSFLFFSFLSARTLTPTYKMHSMHCIHTKCLFKIVLCIT